MPVFETIPKKIDAEEVAGFRRVNGSDVIVFASGNEIFSYRVSLFRAVKVGDFVVFDENESIWLCKREMFNEKFRAVAA